MSAPTPQALADWLDERLAEGLGLARKLRSTVNEKAGKIVLLTHREPVGVDLRWGAGHPASMDLLAARLANLMPGSTVFVELPLVSQDDPPAHEYATRICGTDVFAVARSVDGQAALNAALRAHDPSGLYVAAALVPMPGHPELPCPAEALEAGAARPVAVAVGAFDGEAFVCWFDDGDIPESPDWETEPL